MRRNVKKRLLEIVESLEEGNILLKEMLERNELEKAVLLLQLEQEAVIALGNEIEFYEGEHNPIINYIEEYCELLWQCSEEQQQLKLLKLHKLLLKRCNRIRDFLKWDIKEQYDIVFLPYNASMWDCFESVWLAAKEDKDCTCYVIPLPYFDKNEDQSFCSMHYDGDQFPGYVPVTDYRTYNLMENRPEVIFIHNPYDQRNYVTSVHPDYYSAELKKCTDMLVYIPYFIANGRLGKNVCTMPGVANADKVIVQSEEIRQDYIRELDEELQFIEPEVRKPWLEDKIVALGSPKIDKVVNTKKEDIVLPKEWEDVIFG